ncbi:MAG: 50S ribosomal protein L35 [Candidatus Dojkabacteria bacterium]
MAKLKNHSSAVKRFKITKDKRYKYRASGWNHMKSKKRAVVKLRKRADRILSSDIARKYDTLLRH